MLTGILKFIFFFIYVESSTRGLVLPKMSTTRKDSCF